MNDWPNVRLKDIAKIEIGGTPARDQPRYWAEGQDGYPWLSIADLATKWVAATAETITAQGIQHSNAKLIPAGTVVMSFKLSIGKTAITGCDMYSNEAIAAFYVDEECVKPPWLYYVLPRVAANTVTDIAIKGATLNKAKLRQMELRLPPPAEQGMIAEVLASVDVALRSTEQLVEKLKLAKQGLLHDLLTRGIDDNGELRDPIRHPEKFKDSPLGLIPKEWNIKPFRDLLAGIDVGKSPDCPDRPATGDEWGVLKVSAVRPDGFRCNENKAVENPLYINRSFEVNEGDLLITRANTSELVGLTCLVRGAPPRLLLCDKTLRLAVLKTTDKRFVFYATQMLYIRRQIESHATGSSGSMKNINQAAIRNLQIVVPPSNEQVRIADNVDACARRLERERAEFDKLRLLRQALMDDLLTGRVRVTPLLEEAVTP